MCCLKSCCCCCNKIIKIACSVFWCAVVVLLLVFIILLIIAWTGSRGMQTLVFDMIKCNSQSNSNCDETFGTLVYKICEEEDIQALKCLELDFENKSQNFGWDINFTTTKKRNLGTYIRISDKGIENNVTSILKVTGTIEKVLKDGKEEEANEGVILEIPKGTRNYKGELMLNPKKHYVINDRYVHFRLNGKCADRCPTGEVYTIVPKSVEIHAKLYFRAIPGFLNIHVDGSFDYSKFYNRLHKIIKIFNKETAESMSSAMQLLSFRVDNFGDDGALCPISKNYDPTQETKR